MAARRPQNPPRLAGFEYVRVLGTGGFSDVFLYEQQLPRRNVAVKVLVGELSASAVDAFASEANLMARLSTHPYIVTIHAAGVAPDGRPYLVMEYCSRPSLAQRYKTRPLSVDDALRTGIRLASAVESAHRAGILHRDIKPGNVLTNDYGWPALTDFGIAADGPPVRAENGPEDPETSSGGTVGLSVPWSPPEMLLDVPTHDVRSDVFSLAATLHTVLAGRTPFEVPGGPNTAADLMSRIERGQVGPIGRSDVPVALTQALARGMADRALDRFPSALELGRALQRVELELGLAPTALEVPETQLAADESSAASVEDAPATRARAIPTPRPEPTTRAVPVDPDVDRHATRARGSRVGVLIALVSVLVVAVVALVVVLAGSPPQSPTLGVSPSSGSEPAAIGTPIPPATDGGARVSTDGATVLFTWRNPAARDGDVYYWARAETPDSRAAVEDPAVELTGIVPGSRICIVVEIGRSGRTSEPLTICTD